MFSFVFLLVYLSTKQYLAFDIFTSRDIHRAFEWLGGHFYWPGPEMAEGNNLPGPFFYFLLFPPLIFGNNIYSQSLLWYVIWLALTYTLAFFFLKKIIKYKESLLIFLFTLTMAIGDPLFRPLTYAWNPGFAILFHILTLISLYYWREINRNLYLYLAGLVIALGIQVHFLVSIHIITVFLFFIFKQKKRFLPFILFLFLSFCPVLLYILMDYFSHFEVSTYHPSGRFTFFRDQLFSESWFKSIKKMLNFSVIEALCFILFILFWKKWKTKKWHLTKSTGNLLAIIAVPCFIGLLTIIHDRYSYFIPAFAILFFSKCCDDLMPDNPDKRQNYLLIYGFILICPLLLFNTEHLLSINRLISIISIQYAILLFMILMLLLAINIKWTYKSVGKAGLFFILLLLVGQVKIVRKLSPWNYPIKQSFYRKRIKYQHLYSLMERMYLETNWPAKKAVKRIYVIGFSPEVSMFLNYEMARENIKKKIQNKSLKQGDIHLKLEQPLEKPNGYMIIQHIKKFTNYSKKDWEQYLSHSTLLLTLLRQEITEKKILIKTPKMYDNYWLIPYKTIKESIFVEGFYNMGQPYYWEEPEWLKRCTHTQQFKSKEGFYYCMILQGHSQRVGVHMKLFQNIRTNLEPSLKINFFGSAIGSSDCCSSGNSRVLWSDIQINLLCDNIHYRYNAPNIGNNWTNNAMKNPYNQGQHFTAPLKIEIPVGKFKVFSGKSSVQEFFNCKNKDIKKIELTLTHLHKTRFQKNPPPKKINITWEL